METIFFQAFILNILYGGPEIPQGYTVIVGNSSDSQVEGVVALKVVRFGCQDWERPLVDGIFDDLAQVTSLLLRGDIGIDRLYADDHKCRFGDTQLAAKGVFPLVAGGNCGI